MQSHGFRFVIVYSRRGIWYSEIFKTRQGALDFGFNLHSNHLADEYFTQRLGDCVGSFKSNA